jgi:hypothetical protein
LSLEVLEDRLVPSAVAQDHLYVGDGADNTVKEFNATTGAFEGNLVAPGSQGMNGPRGLIFRNNGQLLAVNQNVNEPFNGAVLRYNGITGVPLGALVPQTDPNGPFAPRGMVLGPDHTLYVADDGNLDGITLGRVTRFNSETGAFLGDLQPTGFTGDFYPRGVVIGPDGDVYASVRNIAATGGEVMRWDPATGQFLGSFVTGDAVNDLNRPEGIVFGPDGNLYVASFRANAGDNDKVLIFAGPNSATPGAYLGNIALDTVGGDRNFAEALLFGPGGKLFVPITGFGADTGEVRSYDVTTKAFTAFVAPNALGGPLGQPWYLTFGQTDPATLAYGVGSSGANPAADSPALASPGVSTANSLLVTAGLAVVSAPPSGGTAGTSSNSDPSQPPGALPPPVSATANAVWASAAGAHRSGTAPALLSEGDWLL